VNKTKTNKQTLANAKTIKASKDIPNTETNTQTKMQNTIKETNKTNKPSKQKHTKSKHTLKIQTKTQA